MKLRKFTALITTLALAATSFIEAEASQEPTLKNIRQLTFESMGFERAGEAYFSPDERSIIFQATAKGQEGYQMYLMDLEEGAPKLISTGRGRCTCGFFHPNANKVIFASSHEAPEETEEEKEQGGKYRWQRTRYMNIYEADLETGSLKPLTEGSAYHAECAYSPDGSKIVYASDEDGSMNLYLMNSDGSGKQQLTHTSGCYNGGPFFSPDGLKIVFRADRHEENKLQIYIIDLDGANQKQLTDNDAVNWSPYWHPSGLYVAFTTSLHGHDRYEIYLVEIESRKLYRVTDQPLFDGLPVFNRSGDKLMWTSKRGDQKNCQLFIADFLLPQDLR